MKHCAGQFLAGLILAIVAVVPAMAQRYGPNVTDPGLFVLPPLPPVEPLFRQPPPVTINPPPPNPSIVGPPFARDVPGMLPPAIGGCPRIDPTCRFSPNQLGAGQDLRVTVERAGRGVAPSRDEQLATIRALAEALGDCWAPPPGDNPRRIEVTLRFGLNRHGHPMGPPRVTCTTPGLRAEDRDRYREAAHAAVRRCTPLPVSASLGRALAGRPIALRFVDEAARNN